MVCLTKASVIGMALLVLGGGAGYGAVFEDVPKDAWYAGDLALLAEMGAVAGYRLPPGSVVFSPERVVTRSEFLKMCLHTLSRGPGLSVLPTFPSPSQPPYPDVPVFAWYAGYVAFAKQWEIVDPALARFDPGLDVTRRDAVRFVMETLDLNGGARDIRPPRGFPDSVDPAVINAYSAGIVDGQGDGMFHPNSSLNRAEAVALIARAFRNLLKPLPVRFEMTAYMPGKAPLIENPIECPCSSFGIRLNRPDSVENLVRVRLHGNPLLDGGKTYYALRRSNEHIKVWPTRDKFWDAYLDDNDTYRFEFGVAEDVFVENVISGESILSLELRRSFDDGIVARQDVAFRTLDHLVVVIGGRTQEPGSCSDGCGIFAIGEELYRNGYDVWLFNQEDVGTDGLGRPYDLIRQAITQRGVSRLAILGYSWGGGATFDLASALTETPDLGEFAIVYTAYVDAIKTASNSYEDQRPPRSEFHLNFSQIKSCRDDPIKGLCGTSIFSSGDLITVNVPVNNLDWGTELNHFSIDDAPSVSLMIVGTIKERVQP